MSDNILNFQKFQIYILAEVALLEKLQKQTHKNVKNCYLAIAWLQNENNKNKITVFQLFIKQKLTIGKWIVLSDVVSNKEPKFFLPFGIDCTVDIMNYTNCEIIQDRDKETLVFKHIVRYYVDDLQSIVTYNQKVNNYEFVEFKTRHLMCANALFGGDHKKFKGALLCSIHNNWAHYTQSGKHCYVFDVQSGQQKFSIIDWELNTNYKSIFNDNFEKGRPTIFYKVEFNESIKNKPYMMSNVNTFILHNFCLYLRTLLKSGNYPNEKGIRQLIPNMEYIWMNPLQHDIEDFRFFKYVQPPTLPTFQIAKDKVVELANKDTKNKAQVYFFLYPKDIKSVADPQDMEANIKHFCPDCNRVNTGIEPRCMHSLSTIPWLEIQAPICFEYEKMNRTKINVIIVLSAIKDMFKLLSEKDINIERWSEIGEFVTKTFDKKQIWNHDTQSQYFIPIIHSFFNVMTKFDVKLKLRINVSGRYTNYYMVNVIKTNKDKLALNEYQINNNQNQSTISNDYENANNYQPSKNHQKQKPKQNNPTIEEEAGNDNNDDEKENIEIIQKENTNNQPPTKKMKLND